MKNTKLNLHSELRANFLFANSKNGHFVFQQVNESLPASVGEKYKGKDAKEKEEKGASEAVGEAGRQSPSDMAAAAIAKTGQVATFFTGVTTALTGAIFDEKTEKKLRIQQQDDRQNDKNSTPKPPEKN